MVRTKATARRAAGAKKPRKDLTKKGARTLLVGGFSLDPATYDHAALLEPASDDSKLDSRTWEVLDGLIVTSFTAPVLSFSHTHHSFGLLPLTRIPILPSFLAHTGLPPAAIMGRARIFRR